MSLFYKLLSSYPCLWDKSDLHSTDTIIKRRARAELLQKCNAISVPMTEKDLIRKIKAFQKKLRRQRLSHSCATTTSMANTSYSTKDNSALEKILEEYMVQSSTGLTEEQSLPSCADSQEYTDDNSASELIVEEYTVQPTTSLSEKQSLPSCEDSQEYSDEISAPKPIVEEPTMQPITSLPGKQSLPSSAEPLEDSDEIETLCIKEESESDSPSPLVLSGTSSPLDSTETYYIKKQLLQCQQKLELKEKEVNHLKKRNKRLADKMKSIKDFVNNLACECDASNTDSVKS